MLLILAAALACAAPASGVTRIPARCSDRPAPVMCAIRFHRARADRLRHRMGLAKLPYGHAAERYPERRPRLLHYWRHTHARALRRYHRYMAEPWLHGPVHDALVCIHGYEGAWNAETGNGYHGGLQMDASFEAAYGSAYLSAYGHAGNWPVTDQLHAAYRAVRVRGFTPWPLTARRCGLL